MTSFNKVLITFLFGVSVILFAAWEFIQSEYVANIITKSITKLTKEKLDTELKFERLRFELFPPGAFAEKVSAISNTKNNKYSVFLDSLGVSFDLLDVFRTKFTISNIYLTDGRVNIKKIAGYSKEKNQQKEKNELKKNLDVEGILQSLNKNLPIKLKKLTLNQINLDILDYRVTTEKALIILGKDKIGINLMLQSFDLAKLGLYSEIVDNMELYSILGNQGLKINRLLINKDLNELILKGNVKNYLVPKLTKVSLDGNLSFDVDDIKKYIDLSKIGKLERGYANANFRFSGGLEKFEGTLDIKGENLITDFAYAELIGVNAEINESRIEIKKFTLKSSEQEVELKKKFELYNFVTKKFIEDPVLLEAKSLYLDNALRFKRDLFKSIQGKISGNITFILNEKDFHFLVEDNTYLTDFVLDVDGKRILGADKIIFDQMRFDNWEDRFEAKIGFKLNKSKGFVSGTVKNGVTSFVGENLQLNLEEFGPFSGFNIQGFGKANVKALVTENKNELFLESSLNSFEFEGFKFDELKSSLKFDLNKKMISFSKVKGVNGDSDLYANGEVLLDSLVLKADVEHKKLIWKDLKSIYYPIMSSIDFIPDSTYGNWSSSYKLSGKATLEDIQVAGRFEGKNNVLFDEGFDDVSFSYYLENQELSFLNIKALKSQGRLFGGFKYNLKNNEQQFWGNIVKIPLKEISHYKKLPLNIEGEINGLYKGFIQKNGIKAKLELNLSKTEIDNQSVADSYFLGTINDKDVEISSTLLGKQIEIFSRANLENEKTSKAEVRLDIPDVNIFLSTFNFVESSSQKVKGELKVNSSLIFNTNNLKNTDFNLNVKKFKLVKDQINIDYSHPMSEVLVKNGEIKKWQLLLKGKNIYLSSKAQGEISKNMRIKSKGRVDASILEIFNGIVLSSAGTISGSVVNTFDEGVHDYSAKVVSSNLSLTSALSPLSFDKGKLLASFENNTLYLNKLNAEINSGTLDVKGTVDFKNIIPNINLDYRFNNAGMTIMKKSNLVFSGTGILKGASFPYNLSGDIDIKQLLISNEVTDFIGDDSIATKEIDFLPKNTKQANNQLLNLNMDITTSQPIKIVNSMANIGFVGALRVTGGEKDPRLNGKLELSTNKNQIFFKNNEFNLSKGNIFFYRKNDYKNPELDFEATSLINEYSLSVRLFDFVDNFKLDMSSDPSLAKGDILSLIAFGYTDDISSNLSDEERENITRTGVGSIIFDRFKINETLKNEFGLEVNLGSEITEDERSYLSFREGESAVGRIRSATKLEIKKQMTEEVDLSVSSTIGSSTAQRQTMNLNYSIKEGLSLEGVYENRTDPEAEGNIEDTSIGADVKIKWSFK